MTKNVAFRGAKAVKNTLAIVVLAAASQAALATTYAVTDTAGLKTALTKVVAGDTITLANGTYTGPFVINRSGSKSTSTSNKSITLTGGSGAILTNGAYTGYILQLDYAKYWNIKGITLKKGKKGIMLDTSSYNIIDGVTVTDIGEEGVHFRMLATNNVIRNSTVTYTGKIENDYGEGIYVGLDYTKWPGSTYRLNGAADASDYNCIENNIIGPEVLAEGIDIKEGAKYTSVLNNTYNANGIDGKVEANGADSFIDVKGNNSFIYGNKITNSSNSTLFTYGFETHEKVTGYGDTNTFQKNTVSVGNTSAGYGFYIDSKTSGNKVCSDNVVTNAKGVITGGSTTSCSTPASTATVCPAVLLK